MLPSDIAGEMSQLHNIIIDIYSICRDDWFSLESTLGNLRNENCVRNTDAKKKYKNHGRDGPSAVWNLVHGDPARPASPNTAWSFLCDRLPWSWCEPEPLFRPSKKNTAEPDIGPSAVPLSLNPLPLLCSLLTSNIYRKCTVLDNVDM